MPSSSLSMFNSYQEMQTSLHPSPSRVCHSSFLRCDDGATYQHSELCFPTLSVAVTKTGAARLSLPPTWYSADKVKSSVEIANEETKSLLTKSLKPPKKKTDKKAKDGNEEKN